MIPIFFQARYLPAVGKFQVELHAKAPESERFIELMEPERFLRWVDNLDTDISIGGTKINFAEGEEARAFVVDYFKKVAASYRTWKD